MVEQLTLWIHIGTGIIALVTGVLALGAKKGGRVHIRSGQLFVGSMAVVIATVFLLTTIEATTFRSLLSLVGVFTGYFIVSGYRAIRRKTAALQPTLVDWGIVGVLSLVSVGLIGWGITLLLDGQQFGIVLAVFGGIGIAFSYRDTRRYRAGGPNETWMSDHMTGMIGGYIATVTAVSATNLDMLPTAVAWLWPVAVGVPVIWYFSAKYDDAGPLANAISM